MSRHTTIRNRSAVGCGVAHSRSRLSVSTGKTATALLALTLLCSCKSQLYSRVTERDANEILATLYTAGVRAEKSTHDEKTWSVEVDEHDLQRALQVAAEHGLPREQFVNTGDLFKKQGLISTPSEERIRYIYAVSQELSNTLSQIDGVISARVHPVIPANDPLGGQIRPSSASVFIKYRHDANLESMAPAIKNLIMHSIEGLGYENISLTFVVAEESPPKQSPAPLTTPHGPINATVGALGTLLLLVCGGCGYLFTRSRTDMAAKEAMRAMSGPHARQRGPDADNIVDSSSEPQDAADTHSSCAYGEPDRQTVWSKLLKGLSAIYRGTPS